jgi:hypothetical protein
VHLPWKANKGTAVKVRLRGPRQERRFRKGHENFIARAGLKNNDRRSSGGPLMNGLIDEVESRLSGDARAIEDRVQAFSQNELHARYHDLVDQRFERLLEYTERFELERIEARMDFEAKDDLEVVASLGQAWERERNELLASLERLLAGFRAAQ